MIRTAKKKKKNTRLIWLLTQWIITSKPEPLAPGARLGYSFLRLLNRISVSSMHDACLLCRPFRDEIITYSFLMSHTTWHEKGARTGRAEADAKKEFFFRIILRKNGGKRECTAAWDDQISSVRRIIQVDFFRTWKVKPTQRTRIEKYCYHLQFYFSLKGVCCGTEVELIFTANLFQIVFTNVNLLRTIRHIVNRVC